MRTRLLFSEEDEVRKKKTLIVVVAFLLIPSLLGLYAATGPGGELIAGMTPTALPSPSVVATVTPPVPTFTATAVPSATAMAEATATPLSTPVGPEPTATPSAVPIALEPTSTPTPVGPEPTATPVEPEPTATPVRPEPTVTPTAVPVALKPTSTPTPLGPEPTATPSAVPIALEPTSTPTLVPTAPLAVPVITTPPDGSVLKDERPTIAGTAPPNTTVQVYDDGALMGTTVTDAQGAWALVVDEPLGPREHIVTAVASDDVGRTSAPSVAVAFTVAVERLPVTGSSGFVRWLNGLLSAVFP